MNLRQFIQKSQALKLYREYIKIAPNHVRDEWIQEVRTQFEENRYADDKLAQTLIAAGFQQLKKVKKWN
ncbi:unnamed protein product [Paramecium sonneborni]|uniref:Complex 1 LYR protein domain-containing protein n=1 Tax=Paramecium sonneborni TaxID=65129 RepID=A0A8S1KKT2_9CILI|nr:unnamed protein product [Paramecium sonneborni]